MSTPAKVMNRNWVVLGAVLVQLCLGAIYAWSVFTPYLVPKAPKEGKEILVKVPVDGVEVGMIVPKTPVAKPGEKVVETTIGTQTFQVAVPETWNAGDPIPALKPSPTQISASKAGWTKVRTQIVFSCGLAFFAMIMVMAGRLMPKYGPRKLAMAGGVVLGAGYFLAGLLGAHNFWVTLFFVGIIGGSGIGLGYVVPIAVGMRWFPDKKGLITGLAVAGFGFGALLWVKLGGSWAHLLDIMGLNGTLMLYGAIFGIAVLIGGTFMVFPPDGWKPEGWTPPPPKPGIAATGSEDFTSAEMLRTTQFYLIHRTFALGASAGLMSIGLMQLFPMEALVGNGIDPEKAKAISGTAMGVFFALSNGLGRIAWGAISDRIGRKVSVVTMMATQGLIVLAFPFMAGTPWLLYLGATLIGFNFGGNFALFPTITADTFGTKYIGQNYGWVFLAYGVGGIFGPIMGGKLGDMGNFPIAFMICGILCLDAAAVIATAKLHLEHRPDHP